MKITIDHREKRSGVSELLQETNFEITWENLLAGDYLMEGRILIERKTVEDFAQSLISGRLFGQCKKLSVAKLPLLLIIEGNFQELIPRFNRQAIQGALISITSAWQIPILYTADIAETVNCIIQIEKQETRRREIAHPKYLTKPATYNSQVYFLQNLPKTGPELTLRLLRRFGSIRSISNASIKDLKSIDGIGKQKAALIFNFFRKEITAT